MAYPVSLDLTADIIDVRDIIARAEEIESELQTAHEGDGTQDAPNFETWVSQTAGSDSAAFADECREALALAEILAALCGNGGDEQWRGDWYPVTLIRDSYFVDAMRELCEDIGVLPEGAPAYLVIDWDATASNLRADYTSCEVEGTPYWYR